jgi:glutamate-5-semialdehyde dehydrogenase
MEDFLKKAKASSGAIAALSGTQKRTILEAMADAIDAGSDAIIAANVTDMQYAVANGISEALQDRLMLDASRIAGIVSSLREIASLREPVGKVLDGWYTDAGFKVEKVSVPIGVIGVIYESRPNVTADVGALCFKSGNVAILKGGKEAEHSNRAIAEVLQGVLRAHDLPIEAIALLPDSSREGVAT